MRRAEARACSSCGNPPLPDTPSLPIGADAVTMLEHVGAYATFPNLGIAVKPHAILEVRTGDGNLIWRFDRDGPKPHRALAAGVAADMIKMMNSVVENGTAMVLVWTKWDLIEDKEKRFKALAGQNPTEYRQAEFFT